MNKKLLCLCFLCFIFLNINKTFSQCTPDPNNHSLITPDTTTNFVSGIVTHPYSQIVYIHPPTDTTVVYNSLTVNIDPVDSIVINSFTNLPPGLSYACNPSSCSFPGGVSGCVSIAGTPTTAGLYQLNVIITAYGKISGTGFAIFATDTIHSYRILINSNTGIPSYGQNSNFQLLDFGPDPIQEKLTLKMNSPVSTTADFSVFNILGKNVFSKATALNPGENEIVFNTKNLSPGVYILTLKKDPYVLTRRFVIGGK